jgi:hypothetical protein
LHSGGTQIANGVSELATLLAPLTHVRLYLVGKLDAVQRGTPPPSAERLARELDQARNTDELARTAANELGRRTGPCRGLSKQLSLLHDQPETTRAAYFRRTLDQGLRDCQCGWVDIDALEYLVLRLFDPPAQYGALALPEDETGHPLVPSEPELSVEQWVQRL